MKFIEWLANIDRRVIFVFIALSIIIPILLPMGLPIVPTPHVEHVYEQIDQLPKGSVVLLSFDYDPAAAPEVHPMALALLRHCFEKEHKVVITALWPQGASMALLALDVVTEEYNVIEGIDYVNLGYKPGGGVLLQLMGTSIHDAFPTDIDGKSVDEIPLMKQVRNFNNIDFIVDLSAGDPGIPIWVTIVAAQFDTPVAGGCTAVSAPQFFAYLQSGQLAGLMAGLKGGAEYENLVGHIGDGTKFMDAQSIAHVVIIMFILFANISFFVLRSTRKKDDDNKNEA